VLRAIDCDILPRQHSVALSALPLLLLESMSPFTLLEMLDGILPSRHEVILWQHFPAFWTEAQTPKGPTQPQMRTQMRRFSVK
jgi:hypothetical protein